MHREHSQTVFFKYNVGVKVRKEAKIPLRARREQIDHVKKLDH